MAQIALRPRPYVSEPGQNGSPPEAGPAPVSGPASGILDFFCVSLRQAINGRPRLVASRARAGEVRRLAGIWEIGETAILSVPGPDRRI